MDNSITDLNDIYFKTLMDNLTVIAKGAQLIDDNDQTMINLLMTELAQLNPVPRSLTGDERELYEGYLVSMDVGLTPKNMLATYLQQQHLKLTQQAGITNPYYVHVDRNGHETPSTKLDLLDAIDNYQNNLQIAQQ